MKHRLKRKTESWRRKLPRPIIIRGGKTLRLLSDCRAYALELDDYDAARAPWQRAAELMLAAAKGGSLEDVVLQFEQILLHQGDMVFGDTTDDGNKKSPPVRAGLIRNHRLRQPLILVVQYDITT